MKRVLICLIMWLTAFLMTSCADDSVLILDGEPKGGSFEGDETEVDYEDGRQGTSREESVEPTVMVHICGCVVSPGVYGVPEGSRVYEVIELAGGFAPGAAESYLNLAETVADGQKLVIPSLDEVEADQYGQISAGDEGGLININTADKELLMTLPGIGEAKALAIIAWRTEHGDFQTTEEIMQVSGIKEAAYEKIKLLITAE
ncbi:MAG: helix-hairpin-helix domain-containing protein [Lachnospiraceae bacterium]|nr:helix-hairpin-helix domain-containing protein [Lachnospiraceae bacterium]